MARFGESLRDIAQRPALAVDRIAMEVRQPHHVRPDVRPVLILPLGIVLPAFDLDAGCALAVPRAFQLRDHHGLLELRHRAEDLANEVGGRRLVEEGVGLSAAISSTPCSWSIAKPVSCTIRSRAKRLAVSTMMTRTPSEAIRSIMAAKPGREVTGSAPLTASS